METVDFFLTVNHITEKNLENVTLNGDFMEMNWMFEQCSERIYSYFLRPFNWMDSIW